MADLVKKTDPSRLVNNATGWTDMKTGDTVDIHAYPDPATPPAEAHRAAVLGEFGGPHLGGRPPRLPVHRSPRHGPKPPPNKISDRLDAGDGRRRARRPSTSQDRSGDFSGPERALIGRVSGTT